MSVQELSDLHQRYVELSQRFRAAWVYHQLLQSLARVAGEEKPAASAHAGRFQELYGQLKECSQSLTPSEAPHLATRFDAIEDEVAELLVALLAEDSRIAPQALRHFFQKFRNYDEKILAQLTRFYLFACDEGAWTADRRDKTDYLVTRLGVELRRTDQGPGGGTSRESEIFASFWNLVGAKEPSEEKVQGIRRALAEIRRELDTIPSLDELTESDSLRNYREFKHSLGLLFFHRHVLDAVVETNLAFRETVRRLYQKEEHRITADYQRIFDLEREVPVDVQLDQELTLFRQQVELFERRLQEDEMRLDDLVELRQRARSLMPRLSASEEGARGGAVDSGEGGGTLAGLVAAGHPLDDESPSRPLVRLEDDDRHPLTAAEAMEAMEALTAERRTAGPGPPSLVAPYFERLVEALGETTFSSPARSVLLTPEVYPFRLEAREVVAYRRLHERGPEGSRAAGTPDLELEQFLLEGAALRVALQEAEEPTREALDDTAGDGEAVQRSRRLTSLGDAYLRRYDHLQEQALLDGSMDEARNLALLRIRLMRDYSTLWLLAHRDLRRAEPAG